MKYMLKTFDDIPLTVTGIANIHYFEFTELYHTIDDYHNFCELLYVDRGEITVHAENYTGILKDNQMIIHRPNEVHSLECSNSTAPNVIIIGFECFCKELKPFSEKPVTLSPEYKKMLSEIMIEGMNVYAPPYDLANTPEMKKRREYTYGADEMLKLRLEMFLITLIRDCGGKPASRGEIPSPDRISDIHQYISEHYTEKILLDNICFLFGTNKTSLCRDFKNEYGITVLNYINSLKIKEAKSMLRKNKLSVTEISEALGFNSIHYFCRLFKKSTGLSPKEYTKTIRSKLNL